ncbi:MAG TPA: decarboxylating 6-phosphogluconate dehydrogenase [Acidimicrobiales bacterium]|nr:decarboxylating 6-phosphogluconate dehydrogenase [Acidimicrobiales bacterium]
MKLGMVGLGRMGANMAERLRRDGHDVIGFDRDLSISDAESLAALAAALDAPRVVWVMVPSGRPTDDVVETLGGLLDAGDVVIDGGNTFFRDSEQHAEHLRERGVHFVDVGTSGGVWGLEEGYCLMVGGDADDVALLTPLFESLVEPGGWAHVGPTGAGHYTKMVHNGIEYGLMQAYAEGYQLLGAADLDVDVDAAFRVWRQGSVVRSWLLDLLVLALEADPHLSGFRGHASDSGEGRWTVNEGVRLAVPLPVITAALFARFESRVEVSPAMQVISALRSQFGGHSEQAIERRPAEKAVDGAEGKVQPG